MKQDINIEETIQTLEKLISERRSAENALVACNTLRNIKQVEQSVTVSLNDVRAEKAKVDAELVDVKAKVSAAKVEAVKIVADAKAEAAAAKDNAEELIARQKKKASEDAAKALAKANAELAKVEAVIAGLKEDEANHRGAAVKAKADLSAIEKALAEARSKAASIAGI